MNCPNCNHVVQYWLASCERCGTFAGFPNRRAAENDRPELLRRLGEAEAGALAKGTAHFRANMDALADKSLPVIAMPIAVCDDLLRGDKYRNYSQRITSGERNLASEIDHADREMVGGKLYPGYQQNIVYAALSSNGRGLTSYSGEVAVRWTADPHYIGVRASLLEENSFTFFEKNGLGRLGASFPKGYRAVWEDRGHLIAAKLLPRLTTATSESSLQGLLLTAGTTRADDEFIEIAIFAEGGLQIRDVDLVSLQILPTNPDDRRRWELVRGSCAARMPAIQLVE